MLGVAESGHRADTGAEGKADSELAGELGTDVIPTAEVAMSMNIRR